MIGFTVTDGDGDRATGQLTVNVNDDTPVANTVTAAPVLDDDAADPVPGQSGRHGRCCRMRTVATGVAGALFSAGADGLKSVSFTPPTLSTVYKDANGLAAQEAVTFGGSGDERGRSDVMLTGHERA